MSIGLARPKQPEPLPGLEDVHRFWHDRHSRWGAKIKPGEYYVTREDEFIDTVLGSCVSACVRDATMKVGGMNHFMLPLAKGTTAAYGDRPDSEATRYGNVAMEHLINEILKLGGHKNRLEVKVFGGGRIMNLSNDIGASNVRFVHSFLATEGLQIVAEDVLDSNPRKVVYFPRTGKVLLKKMDAVRTVADDERRYQRSLEVEPAQGDIELF